MYFSRKQKHNFSSFFLVLATGALEKRQPETQRWKWCTHKSYLQAVKVVEEDSGKKEAREEIKWRSKSDIWICIKGRNDKNPAWLENENKQKNCCQCQHREQSIARRRKGGDNNNNCKMEWGRRKWYIHIKNTAAVVDTWLRDLLFLLHRGTSS